MTFFVKARYDFNPTSSNMLRFQAGAVIEVLGQLESGWWDGLLDSETRGWFPSNYVELISDESAIQSSTRTTTSSPRLSAGSSTSESNRSNSAGTMTDSNYAFQIDTLRKDIGALMDYTTLQLLDPLANPEKVVFIDKMFRSTDKVVQTLKQLLVNIHWQIQNADRNQATTMSRFSAKRVHVMAKEVQSLVSNLVSWARELSRILNSKTDFPIMRQDYLNAQANFSDCVNQLIDALSSLQDELLEEHILAGPVRSESPVSMETRSSSLFSTDIASSSPLQSSSLPKRFALTGIRRGSSRESLSSSLGRLSILSASESEKSPMLKAVSDSFGPNLSVQGGEPKSGPQLGPTKSMSSLRSLSGSDILFSDRA